jgi:beta-lactam-binding protein with PASTA domain
MAINVHFLRISGYDIASRLELQVKLSLTKKSKYITLPHFVTLTEDEAIDMLQNKIKQPKTKSC